MIIKPKPLPPLLMKALISGLSWLLRRRFNKLIIKEVALDPQKSKLLLCNHFSFLDGFLAYYLIYNSALKSPNFKGVYTMVLKKQMQKQPWLKYFGCFSVEPGRASVSKSLEFAADLLNTPGNVVLMYPQGNLESQHIRTILVNDGINTILSETKGDCEIIWSSNLVEYFESLQPSVTFNLLHCGEKESFEFKEFVASINAHHKQSIEKLFRFTEENK